MNWNGQRETLDHLIRCRIEPDKAKTFQSEFNAKRRSRIVSAFNTRPFFVPLSFNMNIAGQVAPYRDVTPQLAFDFIITGLKADVQTRDIVIRRTEDEKPLVYVGDEQNLYLRTDEIAGLSATVGGGTLGVFYLPQPIVLQRGGRLTVEMYKTDTTAAAEEANIVLVGIRVLRKEYGELLMSEGERQHVDFLLKARQSPRTVFLKTSVAFDSAAIGGIASNLRTPEVEEPLLVRGMRSTLRQSLIEGLRIEGEPNWMPTATPIWAIAAEDEVVHENYQWFSKPVYLRSNGSIEIERITNSIDGSNIDAQTGNSITWICDTV
ncbi:MAG: hypothetical protein KIT61_07900 [Pyrinomonadaceae bacterium]|jgi:hypothetical protein|nr:hypothetical protein [Pyrinomonadaceae bacterium]